MSPVADISPSTAKSIYLVAGLFIADSIYFITMMALGNSKQGVSGRKSKKILLALNSIILSEDFIYNQI